MFRKSFPIIFLILLLITFLFLINVQPVKAIDTWKTTIYIKADGNIEPNNVSIQRNGNIYTLTGNIRNISHPARYDVIRIEKDNIILDGAGYTIYVWDPDVEGYYGIILEGRHNVTLKNLHISGGVSCVQISNCSQITLINNSLDGGFYGCQLSASVNCSIIGNNRIEGSTCGLLIGNSSNNLIVENSMRNLHGWHISFSSNDSIYHNNFGRGSGAIDPRYPFWNGKGFWDNGYPSGGNYWRYINLTVPYYPVDVYHGLYQNITGSDGIGDVPYSIFFSIDNSTLIDRYPLMAPYTRFNVTLNVNTQPFFVGIISNSTLNNFTVNELTKIISFSVNGSANTGGFSRIILPKGLIENFWNKGYTILLDNVIVPFNNNSDNDYNYIYLNYSHSQHTIMIIESSTVPEFSSILLLSLFITLTLLISIIYFKKPCLVTH